MLLPAEVQITSLPPRPSMKSSPSKASITSRFSVPIRVSFPWVPRIVDLSPMHFEAASASPPPSMTAGASAHRATAPATASLPEPGLYRPPAIRRTVPAAARAT
jgi:hypothetical protein